MEEIWKDIKGYEGLYQVSNLGRIKSLAKETNNQFSNKEIILKFGLNRGYYRVGLTKNKKQKSYTVHRLVAEAFIPNLDNLPQVNHKDENKLNNNINNLEWCDAKYNINYGERTKKSVKSLGTKLRNRKDMSKPVAMIDDNNNIIQIFPSSYEIKRQLGINASAVTQVCKGHYKTAGGYAWKYAKEVAI